MKITNNKDYSIILPSADLLDEIAKEFILECEIEIAKHNSETYVFDLKSVKQLDSSVLAFFVSTFCTPKNTYYCINASPSIIDLLKMLQIDKCLKIIDSLEEIKKSRK